MKRTLILRYYALFALILYIIVLGFYQYSTSSVFPFWFSFACLLFSLYCLLRGFFFKLDSSLWIGVFLLLTFVINLVYYAKPFNLLEYYAFYFFNGAISSFFVALLNKNLLFFKISFVLALEVALIMLYSINILSTKMFIIFNIIFISILIFKLSIHIKNIICLYKKNK